MLGRIPLFYHQTTEVEHCPTVPIFLHKISTEAWRRPKTWKLDFTIILNPICPSGKTNITMENHHAINGKINYKWPFSIAMLNYRRG